MKKTILFLMVSFLFVGISHTTQAQTKEETLQWLNEYSYGLFKVSQSTDTGGTYYFYIENINENSITIERKYVSRHITNMYNQARSHHKVDLKSIYLQDIEFKDNSFTLFTQSNAVTDTPVEWYKWDEDDSSQIVLLGIQNKEGVERVLKAIMHLAKLSGAKELPKVTENTF